MQHRKVYVDDWNLMEKICLVSGVLRFGDNNWPSICELIKPKLQENRPWDWFTPEACEAQYKILHNELVKIQGNGESTPTQIIKHLKTKCKLESQRKEEQWNKYMTVKKKLENLLKNDIEPHIIDKYYEEAQRGQKEKEENLRKHQEALKKREISKTEYEKGSANRTPNKQETKAEGSSSPVVTSPLLSSLLNNPPAVQYRPTLSTSSFIPAKNVQGTSRSSSFEKAQSFTTDTSFRDSFNQELLDQPTSSERQPTPVASSSSTAMKKLEFQENIDSSFTPPSSRTPVNDNNISGVQTLSAETTKSDSHNLESLALISPNEDAYLSEVDIPPEAILEVIGDLKDGHISIDKLIRDLEASDEGVIIDKELTTVTAPMEESYQIENKPVVQIPEVTQPQPIISSPVDVKPETIDDTNIEIKKIDVQPIVTEIPQSDKSPVIEEQMVVIEDSDKYEQDVRISETDDIANIEINSSDGNIEIPVIKNGSPHSSLSYSSTVAISVELESSFSEQKSDNETVESQATKSISTRSSESELEEDNKLKYAKPVVVIKRIEDSGVHYSNKNRKNKAKTPIEENIKTEPEEITSKSEQPQDQAEESQGFPETTPDQTLEEQTIIQNEEVIEENRDDAEKLMKTIDGNITIEEDTSEKGNDVTVESTEPTEKTEQSGIADDSDTSDKFEDALQTQPEEANDTLVEENNVTTTETEEKSSSFTEIDESFDLNLTEEKTEETPLVQETSEDPEDTLTEEPTIEETQSQNIITPTEVEIPPEKELVENIPLPETKEEIAPEIKDLANDDANTEITQKDPDEVKQPDEVKSAPTKIIKKYGRKRRNTSESVDSMSEISINIPSIVLKEIETLDADIEQTFTPIQNVKVEPADTKAEDEKKERNEETTTYEKPRTRESTPAKMKQEKRDTKTPERQVVKVLRRSTARTQSPLKRTDRESRSMENSELAKTRKKSIMLAYQRLTSHKYSNAFLKPITNRQVPGYENVIYKPMDLYTIKKKIDNKQICSVAEFQRDVLLMLNNAKMFNRINSQVYNMAVEVEEDELPRIQLTVKTLGEGILRRVEENDEKIRKRQSLGNVKKDSKSTKRIRYSSKDDNTPPLKKPKLEENEDT